MGFESGRLRGWQRRVKEWGWWGVRKKVREERERGLGEVRERECMVVREIGRLRGGNWRRRKMTDSEPYLVLGALSFQGVIIQQSESIVA